MDAKPMSLMMVDELLACESMSAAEFEAFDEIVRYCDVMGNASINNILHVKPRRPRPWITSPKLETIYAKFAAATKWERESSRWYAGLREKCFVWVYGLHKVDPDMYSLEFSNEENEELFGKSMDISKIYGSICGLHYILAHNDLIRAIRTIGAYDNSEYATLTRQRREYLLDAAFDAGVDILLDSYAAGVPADDIIA